jgi:hypothetical protein
MTQPVKQFLDERCVFRPVDERHPNVVCDEKYLVRLVDLFADYVSWLRLCGSEVKQLGQLARYLKTLEGISQRTVDGHQYWTGIRLSGAGCKS